VILSLHGVDSGRDVAVSAFEPGVRPAAYGLVACGWSHPVAVVSLGMWKML